MSWPIRLNNLLRAKAAHVAEIRGPTASARPDITLNDWFRAEILRHSLLPADNRCLPVSEPPLPTPRWSP